MLARGMDFQHYAGLASASVDELLKKIGVFLLRHETVPEFVQTQGWKAGDRKSAGSPVCQRIAADQLLFPESIQLRGRCLLRVECSSMPGIECSVCR